MEVASLAENLYFVTVRIDTIDSNGNRGSGTGFIFELKRAENTYPFIVTNKHVVEGSDKGGITFIRADGDKPKLGDAFRVDFNDFPSHWYNHPDAEVDITVIPLVPVVDFMTKQSVEIFFRAVGNESIPTNDQEKELDALEEIIFVGYPNGIWDEKNFTPVVRQGTTATPLAVDYSGRKQFLIDASVFGGSSGSPVFIYQAGAYPTKGGPTKVGIKFYFVGVVAAVYFKTQENEIISLPIPTQRRSVAVDHEMIDLGIVYKANTVIEAIESALKKLGITDQSAKKPKKGGE